MTECSFCRKLKLVVTSGNSTICEDCLYTVNVTAGNFPEGSVACSKCKSWKTFFMTYPEGVVTYSYAGFDNTDGIIYSIVATTFSWKKGMVPTGATCGNCENSLTSWILNRNRYVRQAHTV